MFGVSGLWFMEDEGDDMGFGEGGEYNDGCCDFSGLNYEDVGEDEGNDSSDDGEMMCTD